MEANKKVAFVLAGGGAKGAFQVGALKILNKKGIKPDVIYGTSVGALNAVLFSYGGMLKTESVWKNIKKPGNVLSFNWATLFGRSNGIFNLNPIRRKLKKVMKNTPSCEVVVTKVDLKSGLLQYSRNSEDKFIDSVIASASIPVVFSPVNGCVDGGVREKAPLKQAIIEGATEIHVILCTPAIQYPEGNIDNSSINRSIIMVGVRSFDIMNHEVFLNDIKECGLKNRKAHFKKVDLRVYAPTSNIIDLLEFDKDKIARAISHGCNTVDQVRWL